MSLFRCRFCGNQLKHTFVDLGMTPLANSFLKQEDCEKSELFFPLHVRVCDVCFLVQLPAHETPENIFSDYLYFSSYSDTWLTHARAYCETVTKRFGLDDTSTVVEIASNDGYLLQYFREKNIRVFGVEPAGNVAEVAQSKGIPTIIGFFGSDTAREIVELCNHADLTAANNVLAHVPDINDFVEGFAILLKPEGIATFEFPHLLNLIEKNQFDTIYHEHFSYLSLTVVEAIFAAKGLLIFDVECLPTHGGSLRVYAQKTETGIQEIRASVNEIKALEVASGLLDLAALTRYDETVRHMKRELLTALIDLKVQGKQIAAYGAAAKGNTLLNFCGIKTDFIDYVCDANPNKQNLLLPGTRIPVVAPERIKVTKPDYVLILPWNIAGEIAAKNSFIREWGGKFIVPIPELRMF